jgi:hypothetical protein
MIVRYIDKTNIKYSTQLHLMPTFSFSLNISCTIIQVQGDSDINLIDRSQTITNMNSFNVISSTLTNQFSAPESPLGHGILYFYFAWPTREIRLLWFLESTHNAPSSFDDVSSLSASRLLLVLVSRIFDGAIDHDTYKYYHQIRYHVE